jgi:WD40 repeat protein
VALALLAALLAVGASQRRFIGTHAAPVASVAVSPDGSLVASGAGDFDIELAELPSGRPRATLRGHRDWVFGLAFSPDGALLASASWDWTARLWRVADGATEQLFQHDNLVWDVAFSPDGTTVATASEDGNVRLWRIADGALLNTIPAGGKGVRIWDSARGTSLRTIGAHNELVFALAYATDGKSLVSGARDGVVRRWNVADGALVEEFVGHTDRVFAVAVAPDGRSILSGGEDRTVRLWASDVGGELRRWNVGRSRLRACAPSWAGSIGATITTVTSCRFDPGFAPAYAVAFTPDGRSLVFADDSRVRLARLP